MNCCKEGLIMGEKGRCVNINGLIGRRMLKKEKEKEKAATIIQNAIRNRNASNTLQQKNKNKQIKQKIESNMKIVNEILANMKKININQ